jgi:hypothetical protein
MMLIRTPPQVFLNPQEAFPRHNFQVSLLKTEFLDKNLLWQQQYENYALESGGTSRQRRDVQRLLKRASIFRQESCRQIAASNPWRRSLGLGVILQAARRS